MRTSASPPRPWRPRRDGCCGPADPPRQRRLRKAQFGLGSRHPAHEGCDAPEAPEAPISRNARRNQHALQAPDSGLGGRGLVKIGGCNDRHTAGYGMAAGRIAAKDWLQPARTVQPRPPMRWFVLREMVGADLKAIDACGRAAGHVARFPG